MRAPRVDELAGVSERYQQEMRALVLLNSMSRGYLEGIELVLPMLEHLGVPCEMLDLARASLPLQVERFPLIIIAHGQLDPLNARLGPGGRRALLAAIKEGSGLVSFAPTIPSAAEMDLERPARGRSVERDIVRFGERPHYITARHAAGETRKLAGPLRPPRMPAVEDTILLWAGGSPLLTAMQRGRGRVVQWATSAWLRLGVLGPMAGLDDLLWRGLVWAARKPFVIRGLAPLVAMRVDDVAGWGGMQGQSPLYWAREAVQSGFRPWMGLFLYNLTETALAEARDLVMAGYGSAFPHAFGRPPRDGLQVPYYYGEGLPLRSGSYDEFIYFDHEKGRPWSDEEAVRGLAAVEGWYASHGPLPISPYAVGHWYELGANVIPHLQDRWGADLIAKLNDVDLPLAGRTRWLKSGPFRRYEKPGACFPGQKPGGDRPVYYADFVNLAGRRFFNCVTEIRDDAGYEWRPDNDVAGTIGRGVRQLRRALDAMSLAVLFTHETDHIYKIAPDNWSAALKGVAGGIAPYDPIFVTIEDGIRKSRATRTSHLASCMADPGTGSVQLTVQGSADVATHCHLFREEGDGITSDLLDIPAFEKQITVRVGSR